ncbi:MAG: PQQ-binding-like beta-propeller repeat protein [Planctomycetota bacterium]
MLLSLSLLTLSAALSGDGQWPQFRGPFASGLADGAKTVAEFDLATKKNVLWSVETPGFALSSPIVWGERIYLTTAVRKDGEAELKVGLYGDIEPVANEGAHLFQVLAFDRKDGKLLWSQTVFDGEPKFPRHPKGSFAASTPATDGKHVVSFFGTEGLFVHDTEGKLAWKKDFGDLDAGFYLVPEASWGFSASPVIHEGVVYVQCDVQKGSFVAAFQLADGKELWRTSRDEVPTFGPPTIAITKDRKQLVCNGYKRIAGYDLATGKELWSTANGGDIPVPAPVVGDGVVFVTNSHGRMAPMAAIDLAANGTFELEAKEGSPLRWLDKRRGTYMQTPILVGEFLYACKDNGVLASFDAASGEVVYEERLGSGLSGFTASPVHADGKLYFTSEEGLVYTVAEGFEFKILAQSSLGEECMASPAVANGTLYFRSRSHLTAIGAR